MQKARTLRELTKLGSYSGKSKAKTVVGGCGGWTLEALQPLAIRVAIAPVSYSQFELINPPRR